MKENVKAIETIWKWLDPHKAISLISFFLDRFYRLNVLSIIHAAFFIRILVSI